MAIKKLNLNGTEYQLSGESQGGESQDGGNVELLPIKLAILGDSIATAEGYMSFDFLLEDKYGIEVVANLAVGGSVYRHDWYHIGKDPAGNDVQCYASLFNNTTGSQLVTNQVNKLIKQIGDGDCEKPDVVLIHAGINDRNFYDSKWSDTPDTSNDNLNNYVKIFGDPEELFYTPKVNEAGSYYNMTGKVINQDYKSIGNNGHLGDMDGNLMTWAYAAAHGMFKAYGEENTDTDVDQRVCTMVGGMKFAIETLRMAYPDIKVIVTAPLYTTAGPPAQVRHIGIMIKKAASYLSVPVIDLAAESQMSPWRYAFTSDDGLHPNYRGKMMMAECIGAALVRHFGFVRPFDKGTAILDIYVKDGNGNPLSDYQINAIRKGHTFDALFSIMGDEHHDVTPIFGNKSGIKYTTDSNGRLCVKVVKDWIRLGLTLPTSVTTSSNKWVLNMNNPFDMRTHDSATIVITWRGYNSGSAYNSDASSYTITYDNVTIS
jgi:lysophospholipase L1-like esterase